jgi:uncharacterized protein (UPF0371 family)
MGVNMVGYCIVDDEAAQQAAKDEIIRRYYQSLVDVKSDKIPETAVQKIELLMNETGISASDRLVTLMARNKAHDEGSPAMAMQLPDGTVVTGKTSSLFGPSAAVIINAIKALGGIPKDINLIEPEYVVPIQDLKVNSLGNRNPRLHSDEVLIALAITAKTNENAAKAMAQLNKLRGAEAHSTVILPLEDANIFRKLGVNVTFDPVYQQKKLYHPK